jgi:hypothetical protein
LGDFIVDIVYNMEGLVLPNQRMVPPAAVTEDPLINEDGPFNAADTLDIDTPIDEDDFIFVPIGIEDNLDEDDLPAIHSRKDVIPIYDVSRRIPGHFLWNTGYGVLRRKFIKHSNVQTNGIFQHIVAMSDNASVSLMYPEAQLFPRIFWCSKNNSVIGAIPSFMLNCSSPLVPGFASLKEHHMIRMRDGDILTSRENPYWHYLFDLKLNTQLIRASSRMVFKRGLEF